MSYRCLIFCSTVVTVSSLTLLAFALIYSHQLTRNSLEVGLGECEMGLKLVSSRIAAMNGSLRKPRYASHYNAAVPRREYYERIDSNNAVPPSSYPYALYKNLKPWDRYAMPASARLDILSLKPPATTSAAPSVLPSMDQEEQMPTQDSDMTGDGELVDERTNSQVPASEDQRGMIRIRPAITVSRVAEKVDFESGEGFSECKPCCTPGPPGLPGPNGKNGLPGAPGSNGGYGSPGRRPKGPCQDHTTQLCKECPQGEDGPKGPKGEPGAPGAPGNPGSRGLNGLSGIAGSRGVRGPPGLPGVPGIEGDPGEIPTVEPPIPGEPGLPGLPGPRGPVGKSGKPAMETENMSGMKGLRGSPGVDGAPGPQGEPGIRGAVGPPGGAGMCPTYCAVDGGVFVEQDRGRFNGFSKH